MKRKYTKDPYKRGVEDGVRYAKNQGVVEMFAAFAIVLHGMEYTKDEIRAIMGNIQEVWNRCVFSDKNTIQMCKEITGIDVAYEVEERID